jgi:hypothetical protein
MGKEQWEWIDLWQGITRNALEYQSRRKGAWGRIAWVGETICLPVLVLGDE